MDITDELARLRAGIRGHHLADEAAAARSLAETADLDAAARGRISERAADLVRAVRNRGDTGLMESFLSEYGLSTKEGVALMCLAEALLRVPDAETIDALIEDKIAPSAWGEHLGRSSSSLVNASTWALMLTGRMLTDAEAGLVGTLRGAVRRLGEPVIRTAVGQAMRELGRQFVLGRDIEEAMRRARTKEAEGYAYSYDMLGEAARTDADARRYHLAYADAITALASACKGDVRDNPGISVKFSALHPRYEQGQKARVMRGLAARARALANMAKSANMGFNIDAEEADRLDLSLDLIEAILSDDALEGWDGFGVVVQGYGPRAAHVLDWLHALARRLDRRIMVRLVKGAYWDTEIKLAQTEGIEGFPVFTRKTLTDVSYIACARKLMGMTDRIYPQFATHNAHSAAAILEMAGGDRQSWEFQRLHGMGEALHEHLVKAEGARCRIYAPVGPHRDLLAYLVRRLLENGANSSFVNQIVDERVEPDEIAADPFDAVAKLGNRVANPKITPPPRLFLPKRANAKGWDVKDPVDLSAIDAARAPFEAHRWRAGPMTTATGPAGATHEVLNPADPSDVVGEVEYASAETVAAAIDAARAGAPGWREAGAARRGEILRRAAELYEDSAGEFFALAAREAGKGLPDAVAELREAVDFLRYYAAEGERLASGEGRGVFACISPWNFPLAIFTGQIAGALAAGNAVVAKPAEQTPLIAATGAALLREAGVPAEILHLLPGDGPGVGAALAGSDGIDGMCFTGSVATAQAINRAMAEATPPDAPLIAETGGLNAMIVDSTALPEQAVRDILASAFQSAGQRCSALRVLYVQEEAEARLRAMLFGAMDELALGRPWPVSTDIGPVIDSEAQAPIRDHVEKARHEGRLLKEAKAPAEGGFVAPAVIRVSGIGDLDREIFGPVLHLASFRAGELGDVIEAVNAAGYGLTFGIHTRIDDRVQEAVERARVGNIYVNRNQIGAIVGSQPFGGEGLSGTGPKAGGPGYVARFQRKARTPVAAPEGPAVGAEAAAAALAELAPPERGPLEAPEELPGPTGESNRLYHYARGTVLCLGPTARAAREQADLALAAGCAALMVAPGALGAAGAAPRLGALDGVLTAAALTALDGVGAAMSWAEADPLRAIRKALAARDGKIVPLLTAPGDAPMLRLERHVCVDTTAAGGNAALMAATG